MIELNDFARVEMRVGRITEALPFPEARNPSYRLRIDFGPELGAPGRFLGNGRHMRTHSRGTRDLPDAGPHRSAARRLATIPLTHPKARRQVSTM